MNEKIRNSKISMILYVFNKRKFRFVLVIFFTLFSVTLDYLNPQIMRFVLDNVIGDKAFPEILSAWLEKLGGRAFLINNLFYLILIYLGVVFLNTLAGMSRRYMSIEIGEHVAQNFRNSLYSHIQKLPFSWHINSQTGDIIQRCTSDVDTLRQFLAFDLMDVTRCAFLIVVSLTLMLSMDVYMTLISIVLMPVILVFSVVFRKKMSDDFKAADEAEGALQAAVQENYTGVRVVRAFGREKYEMQKFDEKNDGYVAKVIKVSKRMSLFWSVGDAIAGLQLMLVIAFGVYRCVAGGMTVGTFTTFYSYTSMMIWPIRQLGRIITSMSKAAVSANRIHEVLKVEPEDMDEVNENMSLQFNSIEFRNVKFSYRDGENVLKDVSFDIGKGQTLGVLGETGSGKSTIAYLLTRLYDLENEGSEILIDGVNIKNIPKSVLRNNISLVLQEPFLYSKTIKENITAPDLSAGEEELYKLADIADIHEAVMKFTEKYDTIVGERGVTLSGGQKQRVAIARMLMQKAPVKIFDDSLSAVDTETDKKIRQALREHTSDSTVILISHRISTLMHADKILVLKDGAVENIGSHDELIKREGIYKRVYDIQSSVLEEA